MKTNIFFIVLCSIVLFNCSQNPDIDKDTGENLRTGQRVKARSGTQPLVLGKQLENPFAIANMQKAMAELLSQSDETLQEAGIQKKSVQTVILDITDLYVRMKATDSVSALSLQNDTTLTLFAFPLDYEIKQRGDYYEDPTIKEGEYAWFYTTVKPNYTPLPKVQMEVLSELFIPEHSDLYIVEDIDDPKEVANTASTQKPLNQNMINALLCKAFELTGNSNQLATAEEENQSIKPKVTYQNCKKYRFLWATWTSCDTWYNPSGYIRLETPTGTTPVKGIQVRMWRWFYYGDARTNSNGYFIHTGRWNKLLIGNNMDYHIIFEGNYNIRWTLEKGYPFAFWTQWYDAGYHSPNGLDLTFYTNSYYWGIAVQHNAIYDFMTIAAQNGLSYPPDNLKITTTEVTENKIIGAAPMLRSHVDYSLVSASIVLGIPFISFITADMMLQFKKDLTWYSSIRSNTFHELTHASHFQRIRSDKGFGGASNWWSALVFNEIRHSNYYGSKGDVGWQYIALAEGWANYREAKIKRYDGKLEQDDISAIFPNYYGKMFNSLWEIGCSNTNLEACLTATTIAEFKRNLAAKYPYLASRINTIIERDYE